ncbi:MAG: hypothetical protein HY903_17175 [Deltaproteobacteria bacterium]|nr:hypothetical protein [Deltaproteobacteria bacterium]
MIQDDAEVHRDEAAEDPQAAALSVLLLLPVARSPGYVSCHCSSLRMKSL